MKKYLKTIIFLILSTFSFAKWELDTQYNMIFTSAIKTIPSQEALLYIKKGNSLKDFNYHSLYILVEKYTPFVKEVDKNENLQKVKVKLITEHPIEFERVGIVNIYTSHR